MPAIGIGTGIGFGGQSWQQRWNGRMYDSGDYGLGKWDVTNPNTDSAETESSLGINLYTLNAASGANVYSNNIKAKKAQSTGCWVFSHLDVPCYGSPTSNRRAGLINSGNTAGVEIYRNASGDKTVFTFRIFTSSTTRYSFESVIKHFGIIKITIDSSHNIAIYALINDAWVQQGTTQTYDVGSVMPFLSTKGGANTVGMSKAVLRDVFIDTSDLGYYTEYFSKIAGHSRTASVTMDGTTDNATAINNTLAAGSNVYITGGICVIGASIKIPSGRRVYFKNCSIKLKDNAIDNFFCNSAFDAGNTGLYVYGLGNAIWDGNAANNYDGYATYGPAGWSPAPGNSSYRYWTTALININQFNISGLNIVDYNHWNLGFQKATNGTVSNIYSNYSLYINAAAANKDFTDILIGSNNIAFSNIRAIAEDDFAAICTGQRPGFRYPLTDWQIGSIHDISFTNCKIENTAFAFRIVGESADGNSMYNITGSNIRMRVGGSFMQMGLATYYTTAPTQNTLKDFTFDNVTIDSSSYGYALYATVDCKDLTFTNWTNNSGQPNLSVTAGKAVNGISINSVVYPLPTVSTATVENANKDKVVVTFSSALNESYVPATTDFALAGKTINSVTVSGAVVTITVSAAYAYGDSISLDYTKPASNFIRDTYGAEAASFSGQSVTNNILSTYPTSGLIARWKMNGDANDSSGNGYNLTNNNGSLTTDKDGNANKAYDLVPASSAWLSRDPFTESRLADEFTISAWFKADALTNLDVIIGNLVIGTYVNGFAIHWITGNNLKFWVANHSSNYVTISFSDTGSWHHVIASYKKSGTAGKQLRFRLDNGAVVEGTYSTSIGYANCIFGLGKRNGPGYFDGKVDEAALWSRQLSSDEETTVYNAGCPAT